MPGSRKPVRQVQCGKHGRLPAYAICRHVLGGGGTVIEVTRPEDSNCGIGSLVCDVMPASEHTAERDLVIICEDCAQKFIPPTLAGKVKPS